MENHAGLRERFWLWRHQRPFVLEEYFQACNGTVNLPECRKFGRAQEESDRCSILNLLFLGQKASKR
jgi:hypothetical protein